jgi:uncharacterized protein DUF6343/DUF3099 family protein
VPRTGDEPMHARSALGLRLALTLAGFVCWAVAAVIMLAVGERVLAGVFGLIAVLAGVNGAFVVHRMRQGPHWQPPSSTPPYRPVEEDRPRRTPPPSVSERTRARRYLLLMGTCLGLIVLAWGVVRLWSVPIAVGMSLVAMVLPPIAALVANSGWDRNGGAGRRPPVP